MRGLALEGGGARGAYQIGVVKALYENGYKFNGFVGTSIGAINAAVLAGGDIDKAIALWMNASFENLFCEEEQPLVRLADFKGDKTELSLRASLARRRALKKIIDSRGISTDKMKLLLKQHINEDDVRGSGKDYGLVTVSLGNPKPYELMLEDIPHGQLCSYIMASASFPGFRSESIENRAFLDGAFYDNCPYNLLLDKGYDEIIVVRTNAHGIFRNTDSPKVKIISPSDELGSIMLFTIEKNKEKIRLGYYDGLRFAQNLRGHKYYISSVNTDEIKERIMSLNDDVIYKAGKMLGIPEMPAKRMLFEKIIPQTGAYLKLDKDFDYADFVIALLEHVAAKKRIERFCVYDYKKMRSLVIKAPMPKRNKKMLAPLLANHILQDRRKAIALLSKYLV
jgi:NTE family protein